MNPMKLIIALALLLFSAQWAEAQKACVPATTGQDCKVTMSWDPADSFSYIPIWDGKPLAPISTTALQITFHDDGSASPHCGWVLSTDGVVQSLPSDTVCWTPPALAIVSTTPPPLGPYDIEIRLGSSVKLGSVKKRATNNSPYINLNIPNSGNVILK